MGVKFGDVCGMDYEPAMRVMLLCLDAKATETRSIRAGSFLGVWMAVVLTDTTWAVGHLVTVAPDMSGFQIIEEGT